MSNETVQARAHVQNPDEEAGLAVGSNRGGAGHYDADVDDYPRPHLIQPWQTASLAELLEMFEQMKTAPALTDEARS